MSQKDREVEMANRRCFLDLLKGLLNMNPIERWSPLQAAQHPFITGRPYTGPFTPQKVPSVVPIPTAAHATAVASGMISGAGRVKVASQQRPRANTLSSLSLQDVPAPIQRITAANRGKNRAGVGPTERTDTIPESLLEEGDSPQASLPAFENYMRICDDGTGSITGSYTGKGVGASNKHPPASGSIPTDVNVVGSVGGTHAHTERMSAYVSNRRVSQPVNMLGGGGSGRLHTRISNDTGNASDIIPLSVPGVVWYGPGSSYTCSGGGSIIEGKRRSSLRTDELGGSGTAPNNNNNHATIFYRTQAGARRASVPNIHVEGPSGVNSRRKQSLDSPRRSNLSNSVISGDQSLPMTFEGDSGRNSGRRGSLSSMGESQESAVSASSSSGASMDIVDEEDDVM